MNTLSAPLGLIPLLPLLGSLLAFIIGRKVKPLAGVIATLASAAAFAVTLKLVGELPPDSVYQHVLFNWFSSGDLKVDLVLRFDHLTAVMCLVVTGVGSLIHLYSTAYMSHDESVHRFFSYLNLFMFSMLLLVLGGNLLVLFVGWEGVGLCSYLLIGFWFTNVAYAQAGMKAFVVNRIGDAGFLLGIFLLFLHFGTIDFVELKGAIAGNASLTLVCTAVALCLFIGATGKSAQIPLFVWLPDAMAGPTPVSALIHAATMVTAGVYMMARLHFIFDLAPFALAVVAVIAVMTAFVAATIAITQNDIKKVLAYSTVSQLGFMFMAAASGAYWVAVFHLVTHAFFKACLFLGAGSVIHGCHHEQDMRQMGGLWRSMPITALTYGISTLAIAGIFPFAGYQSKHAILESLAHLSNPELAAQLAALLPGVASVTAFITAFYMTRSFAMTFLGSYRGHAHPHESPLAMTVPLMVLAGLATVGGVYLAPRLPEYLATVVPGGHGHAGEGIAEGLMHSWVGFAGIGLALLLYTGVVPYAASIPGAIFKAVRPLSRLLEGKYFIDELYAAVIVRPLGRLARGLWKVVDQGIIDGAVNLTAAVVDTNGEIIRNVQTGQVRHYALFMFVSALAIIVFYLLAF